MGDGLGLITFLVKRQDPLVYSVKRAGRTSISPSA